MPDDQQGGFAAEAPDQADDTLDAMLCAALDSAQDDPVRLGYLVRWFLLARDTDRATDLDRLRRDGPGTVYAMAR